MTRYYVFHTQYFVKVMSLVKPLLGRYMGHNRSRLNHSIVRAHTNQLPFDDSEVSREGVRFRHVVGDDMTLVDRSSSP